MTKGTGKRRGGGPREVAAALPGISARLFRSRGFAEARVITEWPAIVGAELARYSAPQRLAFAHGARRDGTLHVRVEGPLATELQHLAPVVIERINTFFGYRAVARITFRQGPMPARAEVAAAVPLRALDAAEESALAEALDNGLDAATDTGLRDALARLGRSVVGRRPG